MHAEDSHLPYNTQSAMCPTETSASSRVSLMHICVVGRGIPRAIRLARAWWGVYFPLWISVRRGDCVTGASVAKPTPCLLLHSLLSLCRLPCAMRSCRSNSHYPLEGRVSCHALLGILHFTAPPPPPSGVAPTRRSQASRPYLDLTWPMGVAAGQAALLQMQALRAARRPTAHDTQGPSAIPK